MKGLNNFWNRMLFLAFRYIWVNTFEQFKFKLKKIIGIKKPTEKVRKKVSLFICKLCCEKVDDNDNNTNAHASHLSTHRHIFLSILFFHHIVVKITHFLPQNMQIRFCTRQEPLKHIVKCCNCVHYISCSIMSNIEIRISNSKLFKIIFINID